MNIMLVLIVVVKVGVIIGEWGGVLWDVFGEYCVLIGVGGVVCFDNGEDIVCVWEIVEKVLE